MAFNYREFQSRLIAESDEGFRDFAIRGTPTNYPFLGVRTPKQREFAKEILNSGAAEEFLKILPASFEEANIQGFVIAALPYEEMLKKFDDFLPKIDNWATADGFSSSLKKTIKPFREEFLEKKIEPLLESTEEFSTRVGLVILLSSYVEFDYLFYIFEVLDSMKDREEYYVKMATAWLLQACFSKFPEETFEYLKKSELPKWTFNKAISKICDSYRTTEEMKEAVRGLRK